MKNFFQGNIVSADHAGYGRVMWHDAVITHVEFSGEVRGGADWIVPGFIKLTYDDFLYSVVCGYRPL